MRGRDYDRTMRHPVLTEGSGYARDALHHVVRSMSTLSWMVHCMLTVAADEGDAGMAAGVHELFDQQCAMLNGIYEELGREEDGRRDERAAVGDFDQSSAPIEALLEPARKLRLQFIKASAQAGVAHADIARALNIGEADIARVVDRLRGGAKPEAAHAAKRA